jgi:hypothetical protein
MGPASEGERQAVIAGSPVAGLYDKAVDRTSAYEILSERAARAAEELREKEERAKREEEREAAARSQSRRYDRPRRDRRRSDAQGMAERVLRDATRTIGRELVRGLLGSLFKGR